MTPVTTGQGEKPRKPSLSYSQVSSWLRCRYEWYLGYEERLVKKEVRWAPTLGSAVHAGIAAALLRKHAMDKLRQPFDHYEVITVAVHDGVQEWANRMLAPIDHDLVDEELAEVIENAVDGIAPKAIDIARRTLEHIKVWEWRTLEDKRGQPMIEYRFEVKLRGWRCFQGYVDWAAVHEPTWQRWLVDWKVRGAFQPDDNEEINIQHASYQYGLFLATGHRLDGTMTVQISDRVPQKPKLNKDGSMSRALIRTDWETYKAALIEAGLDPDDYLDMKEKLSTVEWVRPSKYYRTLFEAQRVWEEVILPVAAELRSKRKRIYRTMSPRVCRSCVYKELCLAELWGEDADYIRENLYRKRGYWDDARELREDAAAPVGEEAEG